MKMIEIEKLSKSFGEVEAVKNLSFSVDEGSLFAFLGVNGAGKSTTISIICGLIKADFGTVKIAGREMCDEVRRMIGAVYQNSALDKALSVKDNLESRAALYGIVGAAFKERLRELSELLDFSDFLTRPVGKLSGGQRRRVDIARALFHKPRLLILDEPTTGLDPGTRKLLWDVISELQKREGITVMLTTHYMEEAAEADSVLIIEKGEAAALGTPLELKNLYTGDYINLYTDSEENVKSLGCKYEKMPLGFRISVPDTATATALICTRPEIFVDYEIIKGKMDDVFLAVTGNKLALEESGKKQKNTGKCHPC